MNTKLEVRYLKEGINPLNATEHDWKIKTIPVPAAGEMEEAEIKNFAREAAPKKYRYWNHAIVIA